MGGYQFSVVSGELVVPVSDTQPDGSTHQVRIQVSDKVGNLSEKISSYTIQQDQADKTPPMISGITPGNRSVLEQSPDSGFTVRASVSDVESGIDSVQVRLDGQVISSENTVEVTGLSLEAGKHLLTIYAKDKAGNENRMETSFTVASLVAQPSFAVGGASASSSNRQQSTASVLNVKTK